MYKYITIILLTISSYCYGQTEILKKVQIAVGQMQNKNYHTAYNILKDIEPRCSVKDTLYDDILWYYVNAASQLERTFRSAEQFDSSLYYGLRALKIIKRGRPYFEENFAKRESFMTKNIVVSYNGLGKLEKAEQYKKILYKAYKDKKLPEGMDEYFNFSFFKFEDKNIWGYEWFEELPEDRFSKSFSKIVYYVYSTLEDGSDDKQLYRLHVLMFHNIDPSNNIDYVLTKRLATAKNEKSGTLYAYTYKKNIDYVKLKKDIIQVLKGNYKGDGKLKLK